MPLHAPEESAPASSAMRMPSGVVWRARREQRKALGARTQMLPHHVAVALEAAAGQHDRVGRKNLAGGGATAGHAALLVHEVLHARAIAKHHAGGLRGTREFAMDGGAAADRLDARRTFGEIVVGLVKRNAVTGDPRHRRRRFVRNAPEIVLVAAPLRRLHAYDART